MHKLLSKLLNYFLNMVEKASIIEGMQRILSHVEDCSCNREKVFFICKKDTCPSRETQPLYCLQCAGEDSHDHKPIAIELENKDRDKDWSTFVEKVHFTLSKAKANFTPFATVARYLENEEVKNEITPNGTKKLASDFASLEPLANKIIKFHEEDILRLINIGDLRQLANHDSIFQSFKFKFDQICYLADCSEDVIFKNYGHLLKDAGSESFTGFTKADIVIFYNLKIRGIQENIDNV